MTPEPEITDIANNSNKTPEKKIAPSAHFSDVDNNIIEYEYETPADDDDQANKKNQTRDDDARRRRASHRMSRRESVTGGAAPFDVSYHPGALILYCPPKQRQRWGDSQVLPRVDFGDLFFDLFFVAAAYNVSDFWWWMGSELTEWSLTIFFLLLILIVFHTGNNYRPPTY